MLSQFLLSLALYYAVPGFFPPPGSPVPSLSGRRASAAWHARTLTLLGHHYVMSFGMYWLHRAGHVVPFLWRRVHGIHHWATHPLSRNTYQVYI